MKIAEKLRRIASSNRLCVYVSMVYACVHSAHVCLCVYVCLSTLNALREYVVDKLCIRTNDSMLMRKAFTSFVDVYIVLLDGDDGDDDDNERLRRRRQQQRRRRRRALHFRNWRKYSMSHKINVIFLFRPFYRVSLSNTHRPSPPYARKGPMMCESVCVVCVRIKTEANKI